MSRIQEIHNVTYTSHKLRKFNIINASKYVCEIILERHSKKNVK